MPGRPTLIVKDDGGSTRFSLDGIDGETRQSLTELWTARIRVDRAEWLAEKSAVDAITDRFIIERGDGSTAFGGRFRTDERGEDNTAIIHVDSYERDAIDAEPTSDLAIFQNVNDDTVFDAAIDGVPTLSKGTRDTGASSVSFSFAYAERSKQARDAAEPAGQDIAYRSDRTVDFLTRLGSDKTGSITVSPSNENIVQDLSVKDNSRDPVTHVRGLGAEQGPNQITATATISSYSSGDRKVWRKYENKDIVRQNRLQEIVDRLATQFDTERRRIRVEARLVDVDVNLGDSITVSLPDHDINRGLRVINRREILGTAASIVATLTNRDPERGGSKKRRDDLNRFNSGWQGFVDRDQVTSGWRAAGDGNPATLRIFNWPSDIVEEKLVELTVEGEAWRSPIDISDHQHSIDATTFVVQPEIESTIVSAGGTTNYTGSLVEDLSGPQNIGSNSGFPYIVKAGAGINDGQSEEIVNMTLYLYDEDGNSWTIAQAGQNDLATDVGQVSGTHVIYESLQNKDVRLRAAAEERNANNVDITWNLFITAITPHNHGVTDTSAANSGGAAKIIDTFDGSSYYPQGVDISVNGNYQTTLSGQSSSNWTETVDLSGALTAGQNTIKAGEPFLSERGSLRLTLNSELFREGSP